jgi:hypothetical protein
MVQALVDAKEIPEVAASLAKGLAIAKNDTDVAKAIVDATNAAEIRKIGGYTFKVNMVNNEAPIRITKIKTDI